MEDLFTSNFVKQDIINAIISRIDESNLISSPLLAAFAIENRCNLSCRHCWSSLTENQKLSTEQIISVIERLHRARILQISLSGGEIFLRNDIWEIISEVKKRNIMLILLTNGTLLNEKNAKMLANHLNLKTDMVQISLDGTEKFHNIQRNASIYKKVIKTIKDLVNLGVKVRVHFVATHINLYNMIETYRVVEHLGIDIFSVVPVYAKGKGQMLVDQLNYFDYLQEIYKLKQLNMNGKRPSFEYVIPVQIFSYLHKKVNFNNISSQIFLPEFLTQITINIDGNYYPGNLSFSDFRIGNILDEDIPNFQNNKVYQKILTGRNLSQTKCAKCCYLAYCRGGDLYRTYKKFGDIHQPDPDCLREIILDSII